MLAANYDITLDRAAEYSFVLSLTNHAGAPADLTDVAAAAPDAIWAHIRDAVTKKLVLSFTTAVIGAPTAGQLQLSLSEDDTLSLNASSTYEYDLFVKRGSRMECLLHGSVTVRPNSTKTVPVDPTA